MTLALTVLLPFALGYYLSYAFRAVNAMISPHLVAEVGLGAAELGLLTAVYFACFAAFQLPLGLLLDRYGPRQVQSMLLLFAAVGGVLFAVGDSFAVLMIGRGCIGLGVSGALMACFKANVMWWPRERLPLMNGIATSFGGLGALSATIPVGELVPLIGWRGIFWALAAITVAVAALIRFAVPVSPEAAAGKPPELREQLAGLKEIYGSWFFWRLALVASLNTAAFMSYQTLWAGPWLADVAGLDAQGVAMGLFLFNIGFLAGVFGSGWLADVLQARGIPPVRSVAAMIALTIAVELLFVLEATELAFLLCFAFGFFGSATTLIYAVYGQHFAASLAGRVNTAQNLISFVVAFVVQWGVGEILARWPQIAPGRYDPEGHRVAMLVIAAATFVAYLWFLGMLRARRG
jgi:predicted MFS family arabinose efflux permease